MELATGVLPRVIAKLGDLLAGEYNLQKGVKGEIRFLQSELESMRGALEKISDTPVGQLDVQDKIWARDLRELSYDIEDSIDAFTVRGLGDKKRLIDRTLGLFRKAKTRHGIATEIVEIKSRVIEVHERRRRYEINLGVCCTKPVAAATVDPRLFSRYTEAKELVCVNETRDELIKILAGEDGVSIMKQQSKIVSIVGFGGLGKTTLADAVYEKIRLLFDCSAFVSVSRTPDLKKLFKGILYELDKKQYGHINENPLDEGQLIGELREFLLQKRYFIVIDDIWDISIWKMVRCALPDNDVGYVIITTTRNSDVAEKAGGVYKLKPLSLNNSRKLLYRRIFGNENKENSTQDTEKCPDQELAEVSAKILKKCAGVPLAIITMASLLACKPRNKMEWYKVYSSIGTGLENSLDVENMRKILSFSYYDMPSHLRTCLLYLSLFPEDYKIKKDRLIWMWIAEGFIQHEKQGKSPFELGERYLNDLVNRSMIQPTYDVYADMIHECRVHDMVLDLICSLSREENFVSILNSTDHGPASCTIRRLSLQDGQDDHAMASATRGLQRVRSVIVFPSAISLAPVLQSFRVLRVLDLQNCDLSKQGYSLWHLGDLFHLRYLGLRGTHIQEVPKEIKNIQFLQTLDVRENLVCDLPSTIVQLRHLMCLHLSCEFTRVPNGIGSLTSLKHLSTLRIDNFTEDIIEELGQLTELTLLHIVLFSGWRSELVECLCKLQKLETLAIGARTGKQIGALDSWVAPRHLRSLNTKNSCWFSALPAWMKNPLLIVDLTFLSITVRELPQPDFEILGRLPALRSLDLKVEHADLGITDEGFVVGAGLFPCLVRCCLEGVVGPVVFQQGAMPRLRTLDLMFFVREVVGEIGGSSRSGGLELGLGNLPSLQDAWYRLDCVGASKEAVKELEATLRHAAEIHPNHPHLGISQIIVHRPL